MPPGLSREHTRKRKASTSEGSEELGGMAAVEEREEQLAELNIAGGRQRRSAAMKSHKVWDALKPGAAKHHTDEAMEEAPSGWQKFLNSSLIWFYYGLELFEFGISHCYGI